MNILTHSSMQAARDCLRKHYWAYIAGVRREVDAAPLRIGTVFHKGLHLRATGKSVDDAILDALVPYQDGWSPGMSDEQEYKWFVEREMVARLLAGYFWRWEEMDADLKVLSSELSIEVPIINPQTGRASRTFKLAGVLDQILSPTNGDIVLKENKTASEDIAPDSDYWKRLRIDAQISTYWHAAEQYGFRIKTVLYDVTRKPGIKPRQVPLLDEQGLKIVLCPNGVRALLTNTKPRQSADKKMGYTLQTRQETPSEYGERLTIDMGERPDYYFARKEIPRLEADLEEARYELWQWTKILRNCQQNGHWPRNSKHCISFGRCRYWELCTNGFGPHSSFDALPEGFILVDDVHPELSN